MTASRISEQLDLVITVCSNAKEFCPVVLDGRKPLHWPSDDPADATGTDAEKMESFNGLA
jgi:arsenate reductase